MPGTPTRLVPALPHSVSEGVGEVVGHTAGDVGITATAPPPDAAPPSTMGSGGHVARCTSRLQALWFCMNHRTASPLGTPLPWVGRQESSGEGDSLSVGGYELPGGPGHGPESWV